MLKKILIPATAILTICFTPVTLFAEEGAQLTGSGLKGHCCLQKRNSHTRQASIPMETAM